MPDTKPKRIQRQRVKGWRMPPGAIYVGRPTKWGNHIKVGDYGKSPQARRTAHWLAVLDFEKSIEWNPEGEAYKEAARRELRGHDLACFCRLDEPCHADTLLRIANE